MYIIVYICIYCIQVYPCKNLSGSPNNHHEKATSMESSFFLRLLGQERSSNFPNVQRTLRRPIFPRSHLVSGVSIVNRNHFGAPHCTRTSDSCATRPPAARNQRF